jgi:DEAD/DEAH box helicase domain-containing protein
MSLNALLAHWRAEPEVGGNVAEWRTLPARPARYAPLPLELHPALAEALQAQGISALYTHQSQSWRYVMAGDNVTIVTGTASGKTLCYNLPVLDRLLRDPAARALYLFPTKALAQDQLAGIRTQLAVPADFPVSPAVYDGDTPAHARPGIRADARLVISNPDMLHTGILPHHTRWAGFFSHLCYVVIDEMHTYRGVFGSHVANVLRRLKRIARHYGIRPQFILTSATIGNPRELAERLIEEPVQLVDDDGSGRGSRYVVIYNPPVIDPELGLRRSALQESTRLAEDLLAYGVQTILFGQTRRGVEVMLRYLRERAPESGDAGIRGYRSGYLPAQRREIEQGLRDGSVRAVVATTALELGIDIGGMGAAVLAGYPGTISAAWQQAGRAGRGEAPALALLITSANPLDQFLAHHPEYFFGRSFEQALIDPDHLLILLGHLRCAAFELPFQVGECFGGVPPDQLVEFLEFLRQEGVLHISGNRYFWMAEQYPAQSVSLRSASAENVALSISASFPPKDAEPRITIGTVDHPSAHWMTHPGAVYLHEGQTFLVEALDLEDGLAHLRLAEVDYYTEPRSKTTLTLEMLRESTPAQGGRKHHGEIAVTTQVIGFRKVRWHTHEHLGFEPLDLPPATLQTAGYWLTLDETTVEQLQAEGLWRDAPNDYGRQWPRLAAQVRARDGYRCQVCGVAEIERAHDVHHKTPFRMFASAEEANRLENLMTLCPTCHRKVETAVRVRSGLAGLGFALGHLAPLFLMCDARDLGVHSDPQSPLAEGKPLVALYDRVPAGIGFSARLYELHDDLLRRARELVAACECTDGCPSCVGPGGEGGSGGKRETLAILKSLTSDAA